MKPRAVQGTYWQQLWNKNVCVCVWGGDTTDGRAGPQCGAGHKSNLPSSMPSVQNISQKAPHLDLWDSWGLP